MRVKEATGERIEEKRGRAELQLCLAQQDIRITEKHGLTKHFFQICECIFNNTKKIYCYKKVKPQIDIYPWKITLHRDYFRMSQICSHLIPKHGLLAVRLFFLKCGSSQPRSCTVSIFEDLSAYHLKKRKK